MSWDAVRGRLADRRTGRTTGLGVIVLILIAAATDAVAWFTGTRSAILWWGPVMLILMSLLSPYVARADKRR